jgi:hypothetical protein
VVVVTSDPDDPDIDYAVGRVLRQTSDGTTISHKIHLYKASSTGSWTPASGLGSKRSFPNSSLLLIGVHLTPTHSKLLKRDTDKIKAILNSY